MAMSMFNANGYGNAESDNGTNITTASELEYPGLDSCLTTGTDSTAYNGARPKEKQTADRSYAPAAKLKGGSRKGSKGSFCFSEPVAENKSNAWQCDSCGNIFRKYNDMLLECEYCTKHFLHQMHKIQAFRV